MQNKFVKLAIALDFINTVLAPLARPFPDILALIVLSALFFIDTTIKYVLLFVVLYSIFIPSFVPPSVLSKDWLSPVVAKSYLYAVSVKSLTSPLSARVLAFVDKVDLSLKLLAYTLVFTSAKTSFTS